VPKLFSTRPLSGFPCFESLGISSCMLLARFRVRDRNYLSVRFIFELQNLRGHPDDGFSWLLKNRAYFGSAQSTQLLEVFFARTELLALSVVHSPVLVGQNRDRAKTRVVLCSCAEFLLSADPSSLKSNSFLICSLEIGSLRTIRRQ